MPGLPELTVRFAKVVVSYRQVLLATTVVSVIALPQIVKAYDDNGRIILAQQKEDPKKKKEVTPPPKGPPVQKGPPPVQKQVTPPPQPKSVPQPKQVTPPKPPTPPKVQQTTPQPKLAPKQVEQPKPKFVPKSVDQPKLAPKSVDQPKFAPKSVDQPKTVDQPKFAPKQDPKFGPKQTVQPKTIQPPIQPQTFGKPRVTPANQVGNVNELKGKRKEERVGNQVIIVEPGNRRLIRENNRLVIRHDEGERMRRWGNARFETRGQERYTVVNRGGYEIVTITDSRGHLLRRYRRFPDGREYGLIDNRRRLAVGAAVVGGVVLLGLAAPRILIPRDRYVVDMGSAPPAYLYEALEAPPLVPMERAYSLDEIRDNVELRDRVRSVDINTINFATGSWEVSPDQIPQLQALADAMLKVISEEPSTVFMIEGHTDAVGSEEDNLSLSDRRAEAVAEILTTNFNIPPENLVTQGYGEQHLRVQTDGPSRVIRRVQVRNITGLMAGGDGQPGGPPGDGPPDGPPGGQPPG